MEETTRTPTEKLEYYKAQIDELIIENNKLLAHYDDNNLKIKELTKKVKQLEKLIKKAEEV